MLFSTDLNKKVTCIFRLPEKNTGMVTYRKTNSSGQKGGRGGIDAKSCIFRKIWTKNGMGARIEKRGLELMQYHAFSYGSGRNLAHLFSIPRKQISYWRCFISINQSLWPKWRGENEKRSDFNTKHTLGNAGYSTS